MLNLCYAEKGFSLSGAAVGVLSVQQFNVASIFDPDSSGVGHQSIFRDQLANMFESYKVVKVGYCVQFAVSDIDDLQIVGIQVSDDLATATTFGEIVEQGMCEWQYISSRDGGKNIVTFTGEIDLPKVQGVTYTEYMAEKDYGGLLATNPQDGVFLNIFACHESNGTTAGVRAAVELRQYTHLFGSVRSAQS
jgi:hypothetical protein